MLSTVALAAGLSSARAQTETHVKPAESASLLAAEKSRRGIHALQRAQEAFGGLGRLQSIKDITRSLKLTDLASGAEAQETLQLLSSGAIRLEAASPLGETTSFYGGKTAWSVTEIGLDTSLPEWQLKAARQDLFRQLEFLVQSDHDPERSVEFVESDQVAGRAADVIEISSPEAGKVRLWIDSASGDVVKGEYPRIVSRGVGPRVTDFYSDYQWVDKLVRIPVKTHTLSDGQPYIDTIVVNSKYNQGLRAEDMQKPPSQPAP